MCQLKSEIEDFCSCSPKRERAKMVPRYVFRYKYLTL